VRTITRKEDGIAVTTANRTFFAKRVIITAPLPTIGDVQFNPPLPEKIEAAKSIGWGCVVKILVRFKTAWWQSIPEKWSEENFLVAETPIPLWWVQEKSQPPLLTGWIAGPKAKVLSTVADEEIVTTALSSLADIFGVSREFIEEQLVDTHVANWSKEQHSKGAYSYHALGSQQALEEMRRPVWDGAVYFAGEALSATGQVGLVEGAFDSGIDVINRMGL
jgi:monoamine oxidase